MSQKPLIIANWKMNPDSPGRAVALARKIETALAPLRKADVIIAPPFPYLLPVASVIKKITLGAQDVFWDDAGPYTGEVSWHQLRHCKVKYVIVGHSERRIHLGESDELINKKVLACIENGLMPVLCVGEREREGSEIPAIVGAQLQAALRGVKKSALARLVVAYEPVWAISTNPGAHPDTPDNAFRARLYIERVLAECYGRREAEKARIIYGGSVKSDNVFAFLKEGKMGGALVGGASLDPPHFLEIVRQSVA